MLDKCIEWRGIVMWKWDRKKKNKIIIVVVVVVVKKSTFP